VGDWISIRIPILYPQKTCDYPHRIHIPTELRYPTCPHPTPCVFSLDVFLNKHIYAVHVTVLLCVFINDNTKKKCHNKTNYTLDCIWRNSNSDYDIYRPFNNAFPLNLTSIRKSPYYPHRAMGIRNSPHTCTHGNPRTHSSPGNLDNVRWQLGVYNSHACNCQP